MCPSSSHYKHIAVRATAALCLVLSATTAAAQQADLPEKEVTYQNNTIFLPAISSSPETSLLFGGVAIRQFKPQHAGPETRPSSMLVSALYTLNSQLLLSFIPYWVLPDEEWIFSGAYGYSYFPESFWGVGPKTVSDDEMLMDYRQYFIEQSALKKVAPYTFIGPRIRWTRTYDMAFEDTDGNRIPTPLFSGAEGHTAAGVGFIARIDKRNSTITPTENWLVDLSYLVNPAFLGSSEAYSTLQIDLRRYFNFNEGNTVLAFQAISKLSAGSTPIKDMAMLGGESILRGYYAGRFRDYNGGQIQAELRQKVRGRVGITGFASTGEVWHSFEDFSLNNIKWTAGGGLRFNLNRKDPMNLRMDLAFGENTSGFYLTLGEAF